MVVTLFLGGIILIMTGTLGEYVWRNLDEARNRPLYVIDKTINDPSSSYSEHTASEEK
jgi:dolichol-phosphate mannosyltransferase